MKPSLVSTNRLKISVTAEEMNDTSHRKESIGKIISAACRQTGFILSDSRFMVETVPSRDGGFTICVTRLPGKKHISRHRHKGVYDLGTEPYIFVFNRLDDMLAAGSSIMAHPDILLSSLKAIYCRDKWYISFSPVLAGLDGYRLDCLLGCISEFGWEIQGGILKESSLVENGRTVAEGSEAERLFSLINQPIASSAPFTSDATFSVTSTAPNT